MFHVQIHMHRKKRFTKYYQLYAETIEICSTIIHCSHEEIDNLMIHGGNSGELDVPSCTTYNPGETQLHGPHGTLTT